LVLRPASEALRFCCGALAVGSGATEAVSEGEEGSDMLSIAHKHFVFAVHMKKRSDIAKGVYSRIKGAKNTYDIEGHVQAYKVAQ
jgi:hypothetical protein